MIFDVDFLYEDTEIGSSLEDSPIAGLLRPEIGHLYPEFDRWCARAIRQIGNGEKAAIGAWNRSVGRQPGRLEGVCILKRVSSRKLEIKTLFLREESRGREVSLVSGTDARLGQKLLDSALTLAQEQGYQSVTINIPADNIRLLRFLLKNACTFERRHQEFGQPFYCMEKQVPLRYCDDPGDIGYFVDWLLDASRMARTQDAETGSEGTTVYSRAKGRLHVFPGVPSLGTDVVIELRGKSRDPQSYRVTVGSQLGKQELLSADWPVDQMLRYAGIERNDWPGFASRLPGIIVAIRKRFLERYECVEGSEKVYLKTGHFGRPLLGWPDPGAVIIFQDAERPDTLLGHAHTRRVRMGSPQEIWEELRSLSIFDDKLFRRYAHVKTKMTGIVFSDLQRGSFSLPIGGRAQPWRYIESQSRANQLHESLEQLARVGGL